MGRLKIDNLSITLPWIKPSSGVHFIALLSCKLSRTRPIFTLTFYKIMLHTVSLPSLLFIPPSGPLSEHNFRLRNKKTEVEKIKKFFINFFVENSLFFFVLASMSLNDTFILYISLALVCVVYKRQSKLTFFSPSLTLRGRDDFQVSDSCNKTLIS